MAKRKPASRPARVDVKKYLDTAGGTLSRLQSVGQGMLTARPLNGQAAQPNYQANPNDTPVPHIITFTGYTGQLGKVYRNADEAWRHSRDNARYMRNDLAVMECLEARQRSIALLPWHLETDRPKDLLEQSMVSTLTTAIKQTPRFTEFRRVLQESVWYGRQGIQINYGAKWYYDQQIIIPKKSSYNEAWTPVNGDKLAFRYDDGRVGIRIGFTMPPESVTTDKDSKDLNNRIKYLEDDKYLWDGSRIRKIEITNEYGRVYFLDDDEIDRILVHKHMIEDGDFETPLSAGRIHGVGVRDRIYWTWFQKQNTIGLLMEYLERSALGFEIWTYPMGNVQAQAAIEKAAFERVGAGKNIVFMPVIPGQADLYRMEHIETGLQGIEMVDTIVHRYFEWQIKRYILGQVLSSEPESGGLSASSLSEFQKGSLYDILTYDARSAEETLSNWVNESLKPRNRHLLPLGADSIPVRMVLDTESEEMEKRLEACQRVYEMGVPLRKDDFYPMTGLEKPAPGDEVIQKQPEPPPGMGGPPGIGPNGAPPEGGGPGGQPGKPGQPPGGQGQEENPHEIGPQAPKASPPGLGTSKYKEFQESDVIRNDKGEFATQAGGGGDSKEAGKKLAISTASYGGKTQHVFKENGKEVGEIAYAKRDDGNYEVSNVLVWPEFQRKGFATKFYKHAFEQAQEDGKKLFISDDRTEDAKALHAKLEKDGILKSNGEISFSDDKPSAKNPVKTDSPEFKKWFGKSKVVDEGGKPLVMYHGTGKVFDEFKSTNHRTSDTEGVHFFSSNPDAAEQFAWHQGEKTGTIMPVFLKVEHPYVFDAKGGPGINTARNKAAIEHAKAHGHDGVILKNVDELGHKGDHYIAFSPTQIKSATGNRGTYDPDDPRLNYAAMETYADFEERKHPRGQPDNAGQFGPGGGGNQPSEQPAEKPAEKAPEQPKTPEKAPVSTKPAEPPNAEALAQSHGLVGISPGLKESLDKIDHHYPPANPGAIDTLERFSTDGGKTLTRERGALHHAMIARHLRAAPQFGPEEKGVFTLMGGGPASGKSSLLASKSIEPPEGVTSNADDFKELLPEYGAFLEHKDTRGAAYAHEESSKLAKDLLAEAFATRRHATLDGTGDGSIKGLKQKCDAARAAGYAVKGEYATCSVDNALLRAGIRAKKKGRTVPTEVIKDTHKGVSKILPEAVKQGLFDSVNLWDTEIQGQPRLVMSAVGSQMKVHDEGLWQSFLDKAN